MVSRRIRLLFSLLLTLCVCVPMLLGAALPAVAATRADPITVTAQSAVVNFPNSIDFQMSAADSRTTITRATIHMTFQGEGSSSDEHTVSITPARTISVHWREDTSKSNFLIPGTLVSYYWQLQDASGVTHTDATQHITETDTRFTWQSLSQGLLQVRWYNRSADFGQTLLSRSNSDLQHITQVIGAGLRRPITLWIYATENDFRGALAPGTFEWVGGEAIPGLNEAFFVVESTEDVTLVRDMPHEMTHLVFHQLIDPDAFAPRWFDEGLAVYCQLFHEPEMTARLNRALDSHTLLSLTSIAEEFPRSSDQAELAYAQSWNLVDYMYRTFGQSKMLRLIQNLNSPQADFNQDLLKTLGEDQLHLENQWHLALHQPPVLTSGQQTPSPLQIQPQHLPSVNDPNDSVLTLFGVTLVVLALIGFLLVLNARRRQQQQLWAVQAAESILTARSWPSSRPAPNTGPLGAPPPVPRQEDMFPRYQQPGPFIPSWPPEQHQPGSQQYPQRPPNWRAPQE